MNPTYLYLSILAIFSVCSQAVADDFSVALKDIRGLGQLTTAPKVYDLSSDGDLRGITYDGLSYEGKATRVFAWLGLPKKRAGKVPAVVLVHGGGGTAFKEWVQKWNARGYAAISIAVEGQLSDRDAKNKKTWKKHQWPGPHRVGIYGDSQKPLKDQWMYHAVADTILANSLMRSLPEVDASKVGIMGISWGGVITSTVIGIDNRFAFAVPTYGCGYLADAGNQYGRSLGKNALYRNAWDPINHLANAEMPVLWFSWPKDQHFPLDCQLASAKAAAGPQRFCLVPGMRHGHGPGWNLPDSYAFADSIVKSGTPWFTVSESSTIRNIAHAVFKSKKPLTEATLVSTTDTGITGGRSWTQTPAKLEKHSANTWHLTAKLPQGTTAWFLNAKNNSLTLSTQFVEEK